MTRRFPNRPCLSCGKQTQARAQVHRDCLDAYIPDEDRDGLPEGRWVPNGRGIVVFRGGDGCAVRGVAA